MIKKKSQPAFAFFDASNLIYGASKYGWKIDFKKLKDYLATRYNVARFLYFGGVDSSDLKQLKFYKKLEEMGYELFLVPVKQFSNGKKKADVDSRMTFEMMNLYSQYGQAFVFTGDGDFLWIIKYLQLNSSVKLISFPKQTARELKQQLGTNFSNINNWRSVIEKK